MHFNPFFRAIRMHSWYFRGDLVTFFENVMNETDKIIIILSIYVPTTNSNQSGLYVERLAWTEQQVEKLYRPSIKPNGFILNFNENDKKLPLRVLNKNEDGTYRIDGKNIYRQSYNCLYLYNTGDKKPLFLTLDKCGKRSMFKDFSDKSNDLYKNLIGDSEIPNNGNGEIDCAIKLMQDTNNKYHDFSENVIKYYGIFKDLFVVASKMLCTKTLLIHHIFKKRDKLLKLHVSALRDQKYGIYLALESVPNFNLQYHLKLANRCKWKGKQKSKCIKFYAREIAKGLTFIHSNNIVHSNLCPENILIDAKGDCKISGFNGARYQNRN